MASAALSGRPLRAGSYRSPLVIIFQAMRAVLLARATATSYGGLRLSSPASQGEATVRPLLTWRR